MRNYRKILIALFILSIVLTSFKQKSDASTDAIVALMTSVINAPKLGNLLTSLPADSIGRNGVYYHTEELPVLNGKAVSKPQEVDLELKNKTSVYYIDGHIGMCFFITVVFERLIITNNRATVNIRISKGMNTNIDNYLGRLTLKKSNNKWNVTEERLLKY